MTQSIACGPFRVEFATQSDRVGHTIYVVDAVGGASRPWPMLLRSVESSAEAAWPESPPLQELHVENRGGQYVALLVGRAARNHWSASAGLEYAADGAETLAFDVACRVSEAAAVLGSTYELADGVTKLRGLPSDDGDEAGRRSIALQAADGSVWEFAVDGPGLLAAPKTSACVSVKPSFHVDSVPATVRWRYVLRRKCG